MSICSFRSIFRSVASTLLVFGLSGTSFCQTGAEIDANDQVDQKYLDFIDEERKTMGSDRSGEYVASGAAAIFIGLYGYYNTAPNPLVKLLYAATQTAGVLTIGQAVKGQHSSKFILDLDDELNRSKNGLVDVRNIRRRYVQSRNDSKRSDTITLASTSAVLSALYIYNGYRETGEDSSLRNVYYFLGFNFAIAGCVSYYQLLTIDEPQISQVRVEFTPYPTLTYQF